MNATQPLCCQGFSAVQMDLRSTSNHEKPPAPRAISSWGRASGLSRWTCGPRATTKSLCGAGLRPCRRPSGRRGTLRQLVGPAILSPVSIRREALRELPSDFLMEQPGFRPARGFTYRSYISCAVGSGPGDKCARVSIWSYNKTTRRKGVCIRRDIYRFHLLEPRRPTKLREDVPPDFSASSRTQNHDSRPWLSFQPLCTVRVRPRILNVSCPPHDIAIAPTPDIHLSRNIQ